jgi:hypothetical protein
MRTFVAVIVMLSITACRQQDPPALAPPPEHPSVTAPTPAEPSPELQRLSWSARSRDGRALVAQTSTGLGHCVATSSGAAVTWKVETCLGDSLAKWFVSPDGAAVLELVTIPAAAPEAWASTPVVTLFSRGVVQTQATAGDLVVDGSKIVHFGGHFAWAQGTGGLADRPEPMFSENGLAVEGTTADGRPFRFAFDGSGIRPSVAAPPPPTTTTTVARPRDLPPPPPEHDTCAEGRAAVARAEDTLRAIEQAPPPENPCMRVLQLQGAEQYALCMSSGRRTAPTGSLDAARANLEHAQDALRHAQLTGCR